MTTPAKPAPKRTPKTPRQRAEEALGVANRRVVKLDKVVDKLEIELAVARREREAAVKRRDFLAGDPDLKTPAVAPVTSVSITTSPTGDTTS